MSRQVPELPCGSEMYPALFPELARRGSMENAEIRAFLTSHYSPKPELLTLKQANGQFVWDNYVSLTLARGQIDGYIYGKGEPVQQIYSLTQKGYNELREPQRQA